MMMSIGMRREPDPALLIRCCPKPELPESGYFQGIFAWELFQPLWLERNA